MVFVFLDESEATIDDGVFLIQPVGAQVWPSLPSDRHNQGMNVTFADGHCEHWKWLFPKTFVKVNQAVANSLDLQDLLRLQHFMRLQ